jgi:hypothetical protein
MIVFFKEGEKGLAHLGERVGMVSQGIADEGVGNAGGVAASLLLVVCCPEVGAAFRALFAGEAMLLEEVELQEGL